MKTPTVTTTPNAAADPTQIRAAVQEAKLQKAAQQFESLFVNMLMKNMRSTVIKSDLIDNGGGIETYRSLLDQEMSKKAAEGPNGMGIADMIVSRFLPDIHGERPERTPAGQPVDFQPVPRPSVRRALEAYGVDSRGMVEMSEQGELEKRAQSLGVTAVDTLRNYGDAITASANETGLERELILAVILQESSGRPDAVSRVGATGLMQLMPGTAAEMGVSDATDPVENIRGGSRYLARMRDVFDDDLDLALAGYNAGPGRVERAGRQVPDIEETQRYVKNVRSMVRVLKGGSDGAVEEEQR